MKQQELSHATEEIQRMIVAMIATHPAGHKLCLIGGLRYRLLNQSCRASADIDYHWDGDLEQKQQEITGVLRKRLLPEARRRFGYDGEVSEATGPDADSPFLKTILVELYRKDKHTVRIEAPVEITSIPCIDAPVIRTVAGTVYLTVSDADMVEGKVVALFQRTFVEQRDIVDIFLFRDGFADDSAGRLREKFAKLGLEAQTVAERFRQLVANRPGHVRAVDAVIDGQLDGAAAANIKAAGGGGMIFDEVVVLLRDGLRMGSGDSL